MSLECIDTVTGPRYVMKEPFNFTLCERDVLYIFCNSGI